MDLKSRDHNQKQKPVSVLQGDGISISRILARESSVGQSSRVFYRSNEGVPFRWEMQPGTPKNPQEEEDIPPICPSPLMQSLGLPLPNLDRDDALAPPLMKTSRISRLKKMMKKSLNKDIIKKMHVLGGRSKQQESSSRVSSICDVSMADGPFCCSPWNIPTILDEGNTRIYYCSQHKKAFAVEEDDLFLSRIINSDAEQFSGPMQSEISPAGLVPFGWETLPGTPKAAPENEIIIPPPSPPPAVQSLSLPRPRPPAGRDNKDKKSTWKKAWFWMRRYGEKKENISKKLIMQHEMSFRYNGKMEEGIFDAPSLRKTASVSSSSSMSKGGRRVSRIRRNLEGEFAEVWVGHGGARDRICLFLLQQSGRRWHHHSHFPSTIFFFF